MSLPAFATAQTPHAAAPPPKGSDLDLVRRIGAGDERALGALFDRWCAAVHGVAFRILRDHDDAEDVVEETFWQVWRQAERYEPGRAPVGAWLLTIARSRALDRSRASARAHKLTSGWTQWSHGEGLLDRHEADPCDQAEWAETRTRILTVLNDLPPAQREVIELAYYGGLTHTELAERLGLPLGTVKTRLRLGLKKLAARLRPLSRRHTAPVAPEARGAPRQPLRAAG